MTNRLREIRQQHDVTAAQVARFLGVSGQRYRRWDRNEVTIPSNFAQRVADRFGVSLSYVLGEDDVPGAPSVSASKMPVFGRASAGNGAVALDDGPIDWIQRPDYLENVDGCYALLVTGSSMEPRMFAGEILIVHVYRPVRRGDYCVVQYKTPDGIEAVAKRFISQSDKKVVLEQHNPEQEITLDRADVVGIHYIKAIRAL
jgi:phage repressor protein C with HTH and peptisase S24 domain